MSVLVLQPSFAGGARRRHLALVPAGGAGRRSRPGPSPHGECGPAVAPLALVGDGVPRRVRAVPFPAAEDAAAAHAPGGEGGRLHVTRRGRLALTVSTLLLAGGVLLLAVGAASVPSPAAAARASVPDPGVVATTAEVVVLPGDTLWSLADEVAAPGEDVRDVVLEIEELNGLTSADVAVGDRLLVPS
ncbi:LysM peptidoglycan-binding domain-containing protein [Pseudokineococcus basanitobsidens]|uniref:LysM peptidoglycan-binding domain-containing protein n=1 Tax=Pseudokineococcus basanitobsidens TaxID=1926649 RepID=A0ABU8RJE2_9ACTN